jgi:hypothetical protein
MNGLKEMAEQAGMHYRRIEDEFCKANTDGVPMEMLERFYALAIAKATDEANARANASWTLMCTKMVEAEREACAKVCDKFNWGQAPKMIQDAIRARGEA